MRVAVFVAGTEGDVRPNAALGQGLASAGHDVTLVTSREFTSLAQALGLGFAPLTADFQAMMRQDRERFDGRSQWRVAAHGLRRLREMAGGWAAEGMSGARGAGLIVGSGVALYLGASVAEALDVPFVRTMLQPIEPAREITPLILRRRTLLPGRLNLLLHGLARRTTWQLARPAMSRVRRELGLPPYPPLGPFRSARAGRAPLLNGFSPLLVPHSSDWGPHVCTTGPWLIGKGEEEPGPALVAFVEGGAAPIYVGFGSMVARDAERLASIVFEAVRRSGRRAVVAGGWGGFAAASDDPSIFAAGHVPHGWLLRRVSAAVHHCGAGTTAAVTRAGTPSVPVPFLLDQFFWAARLAELGIGTAALRRERMGADDLARAIEAAHEPSLVARAAALGERLRAEDGVANARAALVRWGLL